MWWASPIKGLLAVVFVIQILQIPISARVYLSYTHEASNSLSFPSGVCDFRTQHKFQTIAKPSWLQTDHVTWNCSTTESSDLPGNDPSQFEFVAIAPGPLDIANLTTASVLRFGTQIDANRFQDRLERASTTSSKNVLTLEDLLALSSPTSIYFAARWYSIFTWPPLHPSTQLLIACSWANTSYPHIFGRAVASLKARARFKLAKSLSQVFYIGTQTLVIPLINSLTHVNF